jgi:hypothetical protein
MSTFLLLSLAASSVVFAQGIIRTPTRDSTRITFGSSPSGQVELQLRDLSVAVTYPRYGAARGDLNVVFDPSSRYYLWYFAEEDSRSPPSPEAERSLFFQLTHHNLVAYLLPDRMVTFELWIPRIRVKESRNKADNLEDAVERSVDEVRQRLPGSGGGRVPGLEDGKLVQLPDLGFDFYGPPIRPIDLPTTMVGVSYADGRWRIVLENQWRQEVILDDKYSFASTRRLADVITPQSFPPPHD